MSDLSETRKIVAFVTGKPLPWLSPPALFQVLNE
jgi:hypothetical protein